MYNQVFRWFKKTSSDHSVCTIISGTEGHLVQITTTSNLFNLSCQCNQVELKLNEMNEVLFKVSDVSSSASCNQDELAASGQC